MSIRINKIILFFILFIIALLLRLPGLQFHSLWFDEASTANIISQPNFTELFKTIFTIEGTPPLFYLLEKLFIILFHLPVNEFSIRFLPMLFGVFSCIMLYSIAKELSDGKTALFSFLLISFSSFHINLSQEARSYSLFSLSVLMFLWSVLQWWKKPSILHSITLFVAIILMTQIHYFAFPLVLSAVIAVILVKRCNKQFFKFFWLNTSSTVFSIVLLLPLVIFQIRHVASSTKSYLTAKWVLGILYAPVKVLLGAYIFKIRTIHDLSYHDLIGIIPIVIILFITSYLIWRQYRSNRLSDPLKIIILFFIFVFFFHIAIGWEIPAIHPRYMAHLLILLFGIIMIATVYIKKLQVLFFCAIIILNCAGIANYFNRSKSYIEPWREVGRTIDSYIEKNNLHSSPLIIPHTAIGHPVAFYCAIKQVPLYVVTPKEAQTPSARLTMFGHDYYAPPLDFCTYYPVTDTILFEEIARIHKHGLYVSMNISSNDLINELRKQYEQTLTFDILNCYKTNQGKIIVLKWQYKEDP